MTTQPRIRALQRLVTLYGAVEEMHSTELQRVTAALREVQKSIREERSIQTSVSNMGRAALHTGDHTSWLMAETQQQSSLRRIDLLEQKRHERVLLQEAAVEHYVASRLKREQMKRLQDDLSQGIEAEERRRSQAASDDRFLARRRWIDAQEERSLRGQ